MSKFKVTYSKHKEYSKIIVAPSKQQAEWKFNQWYDILNNMECVDIMSIDEVEEK